VEIWSAKPNVNVAFRVAPPVAVRAGQTGPRADRG